MLPDLSNIKVAALDCESYDPLLTTKGPGFLKQWGSYVIGFSYAAKGGIHGYVPTRHSHGNFEGPWKPWLQELCGDPDRTLVFANAKYDVECLWSEDIHIKAKIVDIQTNEALLNENYQSYSLKSIAARRMLPTKGDIIIDTALKEAGFSVRNKADWSRLKDLPLEIVRDYAELDASLTLAIYYQQLPELAKDKLDKVMALESSLIPIFWQMRLQGVNVDLGKAEYLNFEMQEKHHEILNDITEATGKVEPFAAKSLAKWLREMGLNPPSTEKGNDSITNEWLVKQNNPYIDKLVEYRKGEKIRRDFVDALVLENSYDGKVHPTWFSTRGGSFHSRGEDYQGTRTGRPSCVNPNLTQIPARDPYYGPAVRGLFLPEPTARWGKFDYAAQEPRITVSLAYALGLDGAKEIWQMYQDNPHTDFHQVVADMIEVTTGIGKGLTPKQKRDRAKTINLGLAYGMGKAKLARNLGLELDETKEFLDAYHQSLKFMKTLLNHCSDQAQRMGYVKTSLGRRRHFDEWEQADRNAKWEPPMLDEHEARQKWGMIKRAGTYKALNAHVQGSAAEQTKTAMTELYGMGYVPMVQVYDELGYSVYSEAQAKVIKDVMEGVKMFHVPHIVDVQLAESWSAK